MDYCPRNDSESPDEMTKDFVGLKSFSREYFRNYRQMKECENEISTFKKQEHSKTRKMRVNDKLLTMVFKAKIARRYMKDCFDLLHANMRDS
jgi:hypothetical protein